MDIKDILSKQIQMDESHGFPVESTDVQSKYDQLTKDLVGLFGEIGEFSNIVKKINLKFSNPDTYDLDIKTAEDLLKEELVDSFIYLLRLSAILEIDIETEMLKKMGINAKRYGAE